jgi:hypothetical protein
VSGKCASTDTDLAVQWPEHVKPVTTHDTPNDIFNLAKMALFHYVQLKKTLALKGQKCQGGKGYKGRGMVLCSNADGRKKLQPLRTGKFKKPYCL